MKHFISIVFCTLIVLSVLNIFNTKKLLQIAKTQTELHAACIDMLHLFYKENPEEWEKIYMQTPEYKTIDSLKQGDWEDFYLY